MTGTTITSQPGTPFIEVVREFDATPAQVFRAYTEPDLVKQWLGPHGMEMEIDEYDAREGGGYRYTHRDERGEYHFRGVFHTVTPNRTLIQTFEWLGAPGQVSLETATFEDLGGRTLLRASSVFPSVEARDAAVASGMSVGITQSFERLDTVLKGA